MLYHYLNVPIQGRSENGDAYVGLARKVAAQGMILLKNEEQVLPLQANDRVGVAGKECLNLVCGGGGSAFLKCEYIRTLEEGLLEKAEEGKLQLVADSFRAAEKIDAYSVEQLNELAKTTDKVIVTMIRNGTEGDDRKLGSKNQPADEYSKKAGYFYPTLEELALFENLEKSDVDNVVLLLNISSVVDLSFIENYPKIKSVLLIFMPGMECGVAVADVLCGDVNPSGRLVDTVAYEYADYPSAPYFNKDRRRSEYTEGIFNGYRYFETFAKDRVMYPFGFGLSYTAFSYENFRVFGENGEITVFVDVKNTGNYAGREVVQVYVAAPEGKLPKPFVELRGYTKTRELAPGETVTAEITFSITDMASFDHTGVTGYPGAWVLEQGVYEIFAGKSARELYSCGKYAVEETTVTEQCSLHFGQNRAYEITDFDDVLPSKRENWSLYDVQEGKCTLKELVNDLTPEELVSLGLGQPIGFPDGTSGVGNLRYRGVPNAQTADGPAGIRRSVNSTFFPSPILVATSWDPELQYEMGRAMGYEAYSTELDILLAPALNIHRGPLGGRTFEYYSEDPLISGRTAAALVIGMQSEGLCATPKHFALNSCEDWRYINDSVADERTIREIYLKGFEIMIKDAKPAFLMTSYNLLNGVHTSASAPLLRGILREEWGYEGATMTDWRNGVPMTDEIVGGNNIKMPFGYPDEGQKVLDAYYAGKIPLRVLRDNAWYVLNGIMQTRAFKVKNFGPVHYIENGTVDIPVMKVNGLASARIKHATREDGVEYLYTLCREQRDQRSFVTYAIVSPEDGEYTVTAQIATNCPETQIWYYNEFGDRLATAYCAEAIDENKWYDVKAKVQLHKGENILKLMIANEPYKEYPYFNQSAEIPNAWPVLAKEDMSLAKLKLTIDS